MVKKPEIGSEKLRFNLYNLARTAKVFAWSLGSVLALEAVSIIGQFEIPVEYTLLVPVANSVLYALNDFFTRQVKSLK